VTPQPPRRRIVLVAPIVARYDAISTAVRRSFSLLSAEPQWDVALISEHNEFAELPALSVKGLVELLEHPAFLSADLILYHFGIYNPLFEVMLVGNGRAKQGAVFHNITPPDLVKPESRPLMEQSFVQLSNLRQMDHIWAASPLNASVLLEYGFDWRRIEVMPFAVDWPAIGSIRAKRVDPLDLLFVGRAVPAKGLLELLEALGRIDPVVPPYRLTVIGNLAFSDAAYLDQCRRRAEALGLEPRIDFVGTADDAALAQAYARASILTIPSFHEGFCVPVVEGLRSGCVPVGFAAGNVPHVANGLGRLVPAGEVGALAAALAEIISDLHFAGQAPDEVRLRLDRGPTGLAMFDSLTGDYVRSLESPVVGQIMTSRIKRLFNDPSALSARGVAGPQAAGSATG
jgi:glycosyltransferase involved in cell wall biosynthesis